MPSVKFQDRRTSPHDALCAWVLENLDHVLSTLPKRSDAWETIQYVVPLTAYDHEYIGARDIGVPPPWAFVRHHEIAPKPWPWYYARTRCLRRALRCSEAEVEARRNGGFVDVLCELREEYTREYEARIAKASCPRGFDEWSVETQAWAEQGSCPGELIIECKSRDERFSAGDVLRQLKSYRETTRNAFMVLVTEEPVVRAARMLLEHSSVILIERPFGLRGG